MKSVEDAIIQQLTKRALFPTELTKALCVEFDRASVVSAATRLHECGLIRLSPSLRWEAVDERKVGDA